MSLGFIVLRLLYFLNYSDLLDFLGFSPVALLCRSLWNPWLMALLLFPVFLFGVAFDSFL
jgi:hypothetical protein